MRRTRSLRHRLVVTTVLGASALTAVDVMGASPAPTAVSAPLAPSVAASGSVVPARQEDPLSLRLYGFVKTSVTVTSGAADSFGRPNSSVITAAGNPALAILPDEGRTTFQVQQSRFGLWLREKEALRAQLEFDLVDPAFSKASPTTATYARLRIARIEYAFDERHKVSFGQQWDLFSPLNPFDFNIVGGMFQAGNAGFMRQQLSYFYTGGRFEVAAAVGLQGQNNGLQDKGIELSKVPTGALRLGLLFGSRGRLGLSGIVTDLELKPGEATQRHAAAYAGNLFGEFSPYDGLQVRGEGYIGQNLGSLGALTLSFARGPSAADGQVANVREAGFWLSAKHKLVDRFSMWATFGSAYVLNPSSVVPNYTAAVAATPTTSAVAAALGPDPLGGIRRNTAVRLALEWKPWSALAIVVEGTFLSTSHRLHADDLRRFGGRREVLGLELGALYNF